MGESHPQILPTQNKKQNQRYQARFRLTLIPLRCRAKSYTRVIKQRSKLIQRQLQAVHLLVIPL
jgi:hypothetical protein